MCAARAFGFAVGISEVENEIEGIFRTGGFWEERGVVLRDAAAGEDKPGQAGIVGGTDIWNVAGCVAGEPD